MHKRDDDSRITETKIDHTQYPKNNQVSLITETAPPEFPFPYVPYDSQTRLMQYVFAVLERNRLSIVESPTGTGKSLTLLTAALTWLAKHRELAMTAEIKDAESNFAPDAPKWMLSFQIDQIRDKYRNTQLEDRLALVRDELKKKKEKPYKSNKKIKGEEPGRLKDIQDDEVPEQFEFSSLPQVDDSSQDEPTKIFFTSRTHSQLAQVVSEIRKTVFGNPSAKSVSQTQDKFSLARMIPLGSRVNLCINESVRQTAGSNIERLNDLCTDLQKGPDQCPHLKNLNVDPLHFIEQAIAEPHTLEDIEDLGKATHCCPYYGARQALPYTDLVTLPYNFILDKEMRQSLGLSLKNQIVIVDEAHNLVDFILSSQSISVTSTTLFVAREAVSSYMKTYMSRFNATTKLYMTQLYRVLVSLTSFTADWVARKERLQPLRSSQKELTADDLSTVVRPNILLRYLDTLDQVNMDMLALFIKESRIAQKVGNHFSRIKKDHSVAARATHYIMNAVRFCTTFNRADDTGYLSIFPQTADDSKKVSLHMHYFLLNPAEPFSQLLASAHSIVLAGGTMSPMSYQKMQLAPQLSESLFSTLSCEHIIPQDHVRSMILPINQKNVKLSCTYQTIKDESLLNDLGQILLNAAAVTPNGIVVFVPSKRWALALRQAWSKSGLLKRIQKSLFWEPASREAVEDTLKAYSKEAFSPKGAIIVAVVNAHLSEGINFSDQLARLVMVFGIPYPNIVSLEMQKRKSYLDERKKLNHDEISGDELLNILAFRAVNQCIGRAVRHINDWSAIALVDSRYTSSTARSFLPAWIQHSLSTCVSYGDYIRTLSSFYRERSFPKTK